MNNARPCEHHWSRSTFGGAVFRDEKSGFLQTWFHAKSKNLHFRLGSWFLVIGGLQSCLQKELYSALNTSRWKWFCDWFCRWCWTLTTSIQRAFAHSWRIQWHVQEYRFHCILKKCPSSWILIVDIKDTPMDSSKSSSHCCQGLLVYGSMHVVEYCYCWLGAGTQKQLLSKSNPVYFGAMLAKTTLFRKPIGKLTNGGQWQVLTKERQLLWVLCMSWCDIWSLWRRRHICRLGGSLG